MFKCDRCGKEFSSSQGLGGHRFACRESVSLAVRQAAEVVRQAEGKGSGLGLRANPQGSGLKSVSDEGSGLGLRARAQPSTLAPQPYRLTTPAQDLDMEPLDCYERRVKYLEAREKLRARELEAKGRNMRFLGLGLVALGIYFYIRYGGKVKLPFFGNV